MKDKTFALKGLTEKQARTLVDALELYMRMGMGQIEYLMEAARGGLITDQDGKPLDYSTLEAGDDLVRELKTRVTGYCIGASKGIANPHTPEEAKVAYEVMKVLRHHLALERHPEGGCGVDFDNPKLLKYTDEPWVNVDTNQNQP